MKIPYVTANHHFNYFASAAFCFVNSFILQIAEEGIIPY
jgi:hypothetical protein